MLEPSTTEGRCIHSELLRLLECATVQQAEDPLQAFSQGPLASRGRPWCIPRIPGKGRLRCTTVSGTIANPRRSMTVLVDAPGSARHLATALGGADGTIVGRTEILLPSHQGLMSSARPSTEHHSHLGSGPRLLSPSTREKQSQSYGSRIIGSLVSSRE
jgi:hypothetical protein